jgi:hypothetical protein
MLEAILVLTGGWAEAKEKAERGRFQVGTWSRGLMVPPSKPQFDAGSSDIGTLPRRRAVARRCAGLAIGLRTVEELASLS